MKTLLGYASLSANPAGGGWNMRARQYDPATGRFASADPLGQAGSASPLGAYGSVYAYAYDNPLLYTDPTGLLIYGGCLNLNIGGLAMGGLSLCATRDNHGNTAIGWQGTAGAMTGATLGLTASAFGGNVETVFDNQGTGWTAGGSAAVGPELGVDTSWNKHDCGTDITVAVSAGVGVDIGPGVPAEVHGGAQYQENIWELRQGSQSAAVADALFSALTVGVGPVVEKFTAPG